MTLTLLLAAVLAQAGGQEPAKDAFQPEPGWKSLGTNLWFDPAARRVVVRARVALREGPLEHLLCLKGTKEHESVLATDAPARAIHAAILLTGAEKGSTVRFRPAFVPPKGTPMAIELSWVEDGKSKTANARSWIKDLKSGGTLETDWVFTGSELWQDPDSKRMIYGADDGDLITVVNFPSSLLDLPFASSDQDANRTFEANTAAIPKEGTFVLMFLKPRDIKPANSKKARPTP
ncbi:YdjY domain-containing protein [Isosphaeraceae bacterium EP7]